RLARPPLPRERHDPDRPRSRRAGGRLSGRIQGLRERIAPPAEGRAGRAEGIEDQERCRSGGGLEAKIRRAAGRGEGRREEEASHPGARSGHRHGREGSRPTPCQAEGRAGRRLGEAGNDGAGRTGAGEEGRHDAHRMGATVRGDEVRALFRALRSWALLAAALLVVITGAVGCRRGQPAPTPDPAASIFVRPESVGLLLTWIDDKGDFHVETAVADVPMMGRDAVRVVDPNHDESTHPDSVTVVDLRQTGPDGNYPVRTMSRTDFEAMAVARREKAGPTLASAGPASTPPP